MFKNQVQTYSGIDDEALGGILKLGGALKVPFDTLNEEETSRCY